MSRLSWAFVLCAGAALCSPAPPGAFVIRNARVATVSGPVLARATVVIRDGLIEAVGEKVAVPPDAWVIEGEGLNVYPGLIDALSSWGLPEASAPASSTRAQRPAPSPSQPEAGGPEDRPSNNSWLRAADIISPADRRLETARDAGFTTAVTFPRQGIFAGQGAVINLAGERAGKMVVVPSAGLLLSLAASAPGGFPGSLMGVMAYVRQMVSDADHYRAARQMYLKNPVGSRRPEYDRAAEGLLESGLLLLPAARAVEIDRMTRFAAELKRKAVLYGGHEAWRAADLLVKRGAPLLVSLKWPEPSRSADPDQPDSMRTLELRQKAPSTPAALAKAGVAFAFYSDGIERAADIPRAVKRAIDAGLPADAALRALTLAPAEIYGVADRLGSIAPGKIANLVVTRGEFFQEKTKVQCVFVDGVKFEPGPEPPAEEAGR